MIDQMEMMRVLEKLRGDAVVVAVFRAHVAWTQVTNNPRRDVPIGTLEFPAAMGVASPFALGFCLARPDTKVIVLDGDGSLLLNLGSLVTIANQGPKNLYHFVMNNGVYATTGGQKVPGAGRSSFTGMAQAAGYAHAYEFDDLEEFTNRAAEVLSREGPVLVSVKAVPSIRSPGQRGRDIPTTSLKHRPQAIDFLLEQFGGTE